eukprot:2262307-Rhodomonas_salina.5
MGLASVILCLPEFVPVIIEMVGEKRVCIWRECVVWAALVLSLSVISSNGASHAGAVSFRETVPQANQDLASTLQCSPCALRSKSLMHSSTASPHSKLRSPASTSGQIAEDFRGTHRSMQGIRLRGGSDVMSPYDVSALRQGGGLREICRTITTVKARNESNPNADTHNVQRSFTGGRERGA